ncbi:MAG: MltR family transcriptional regulator [Propylenella sp.]
MDRSGKERTDEALADMARKAHAAYATLAAAMVEDRLAQLIQTKMPNLSNRLKKKLFTGYGPFGSLSVKIDTAFAMGLITLEVSRNLHAIREVRNAFAHSTKILHFHDDEIAELLKKFPSFKPSRDNLGFYISRLKLCVDAIDPQLKNAALAGALLGYGRGVSSSQKTSREK